MTPPRRGEGEGDRGRKRRAALLLLLLLLILAGVAGLFLFGKAGCGGGGAVFSVARKAPRRPSPAREGAPAAEGPAPDRPAPAAPAVLAEVQGAVEAREGDGRPWTPASPGRRLSPGAGLRTSREGLAGLRFPGDVTAEAGGATRLGFPSREAGDEGATDLVLHEGEVKVLLSGTGRRSFVVAVPAAGTRVRVDFLPESGPAEVLVALVPGDGAAAVSAFAGAAVVISGGRSVRLPGGFFTTAANGAAPAPPEPLPRPPDAESPPDDGLVRYGSVPPRVAFAWRPREEASGYRLVVARDPNFRRVVIDVRPPKPGVTQGRLETGTYYWRLASSRRGAMGPPGIPRRLRIERDAVPPALEVRPAVPEGDVHVLQGRTDPDAKVFVSGIRASVAPSGAFATRLRLKKGVNVVVVEAVDPFGNVAYHSQRVHFNPGDVPILNP